MGAQSPTCLLHGVLWNVLGWDGFNSAGQNSRAMWALRGLLKGAGPLRLFREFPEKSTVLRGELIFWNDWRGAWSKETPLQSILTYNSIQIHMLLRHLGWTSFPQSPWPLEGLQFCSQHELRGAILFYSQQIENTHTTDCFCQKGEVRATGGTSRFQHTGTKRIFEKKKQSSDCCDKDNSFGWVMIDADLSCSAASLLTSCWLVSERISIQRKTRVNT